jgi:hypothetical protein
LRIGESEAVAHCAPFEPELHQSMESAEGLECFLNRRRKGGLP